MSCGETVCHITPVAAAQWDCWNLDSQLRSGTAGACTRSSAVGPLEPGRAAAQWDRLSLDVQLRSGAPAAWITQRFPTESFTLLKMKGSALFGPVLFG